MFESLTQAGLFDRFLQAKNAHEREELLSEWFSRERRAAWTAADEAWLRELTPPAAPVVESRTRESSVAPVTDEVEILEREAERVDHRVA